MRIWSLHPRYLDAKGLVACWRETLLAQAVLAGATKGYTRHPQLERFRSAPDPLGSIGRYLAGIADEADARGYRFDRSRIREEDAEVERIDVSRGQLALEWAHLLAKLDVRDTALRRRWSAVDDPDPHPLFRIVDGPPAEWERAVDVP